MFTSLSGRVVVSVVVISHLTLPIYADSMSVPRPCDQHKIPLLPAVMPPQIQQEIQRFNAQKFGNEPARPHKKGFILWGPHGTGKTAIAEYFAEQTSSIFIKHTGSGIINSYQNSGAETIKKLFSEVDQQLKASNQSVVLLIDEIDKLAPSQGKNTQTDTMNMAISQLWTALDDYVHHPHIVPFFTTNYIKKVPHGLSNRVTPIEVAHLDRTQRRALLAHLLAYFNTPRLYEVHMQRCITHLQQHNHLLYGQCLSSITGTQAALRTLYKQLGTFNKANYTPHAKTALDNALMLLKDKHKVLLIKAESVPEHQKYEKERLLEFCQRIQERISRAEQYLAQPPHILNNEPMQLLVDGTEGLPNRSIIKLIGHIYDEAIYNGNSITKDTIEKQLANTKEAFAREVEETRDQEARKERQKILEEAQFVITMRNYNSQPHTISEGSNSIGAYGISISRNTGGGSKQMPSARDILHKKSIDTINERAMEHIKKLTEQRQVGPFENPVIFSTKKFIERNLDPQSYQTVGSVATTVTNKLKSAYDAGQVKALETGNT